MSIFREYIGVKPPSKSLVDYPTEIINSNIKEFHFILGFANEQYVNDSNYNKKGTGSFKESWNVDFFGPDKVRILKETYANVKVVISIGGRDSKTPFDPLTGLEKWSKEAVNSLKRIIGKYKSSSGDNTIDGIDINYQHIHGSDSDPDRFANYLGRVITELKNDTDLRINVVSIAPSHNNDTHYRNLYSENKDNINWVDYQFYNNPHVISTYEEFLNLYNKAADDYCREKVLPGLSTDPADDKMPWEIFIGGCILLKQQSKLPGIFIWNANDSAIPVPGENKGFLLEIFLQRLLVQTN
ncbi:chitinase 2-like [Trifolium pratense]|uniref:chitinase 2-like n=1 Tax=Trifolium pratense TaxID=57577 RepID=UPI001E694969|nr:chitinase 2-like [Trifolium pratense]XP_045792292.1 chitinase 2-like [Trifolium pratense]